MLLYRLYILIPPVLVSLLLLVNGKPETKDELKRFLTQIVIKPQIYHGRTRKSMPSTLNESNGLHAEHITLSYIHQGQRIVIDLLRNDRLLSDKHFLRYQSKASKSGTAGRVVSYFNKSEVDLCHYQGHIHGHEAYSKVALSTCNGRLIGIVFDGQQTYYIHPQSEGNGQLHDNHYLLRHEDRQNDTCGYDTDDEEPVNDRKSHRFFLHRRKRDTENPDPLVRRPYNANKYSSFVELVVVVDNKVFQSFGENIKKTHQHCKDLINIVNALYEPLNIYVVLVGVVIWNEYNEIEVTSNAKKALENFLEYRRNASLLEHPNDNAHLLTGQKFDNNVLGKALKGTMCTFDNSGGVSTQHSEILSEVATTIAHEMGHNFDMDHDNADCNCPDEKCIMSGTSTSIMPVHWSSCSIDQLTIAFSRGINYCLRNKPKQLFDSPQCGNGFVEPGEQCDCGLPNHCKNPCCNASTCKLRSNASCATGECCNLQTCRPELPGISCREAESECDLPEFCTGESEYCPKDVHRRDAEPCDNGQAFCFHGTCRSHANQCRVLWGPTGDNSEHCYYKNIEGSRLGNCGYNRVNNTYMRCAIQNINCGMLHCIHLNERLAFDMKSFAELSHSYVPHNRKIVDCHSAIVDLGLQNIDPGLTPNGAKCGDNRMCVDQRCIAVDEVLAQGKDCPGNCNNHGVCNSRGHCHCELGYGGDSCSLPGMGGSADSGPIIISSSKKGFQHLYLLFLLIIPLVVAIWLIYQKRIFTRKKLDMYVSNLQSNIRKSIACCVSIFVACFSKKRLEANSTSTAKDTVDSNL